MAYVFLDPDGTTSVFGVIVRAATGVTYAHQCAGLMTEIRKEEGFFVPIATRDARVGDGRPLVDVLLALFHELRGNPPTDGRDLPGPFLDKLSETVARIPFWNTIESGSDERTYLTLDRDRTSEITEAWVPVSTPSGAGVLVFDNSD